MARSLRSFADALDFRLFFAILVRVRQTHPLEVLDHRCCPRSGARSLVVPSWPMRLGRIWAPHRPPDDNRFAALAREPPRQDGRARLASLLAAWHTAKCEATERSTARA